MLEGKSATEDFPDSLKFRIAGEMAALPGLVPKWLLYISSYL